MSNTASNAALRQQVWAKKFLSDVRKDNFFMERGFMGEGENNIIQMKTGLKKEQGELETFAMIGALSGDGIAGDNELEGNEEAMRQFAEQVAIDQIRNGVRLQGRLDAQKNVLDLIEPSRGALKRWQTEFLERQFFLKLGGVTNTALTDMNGKAFGTRALWSNTPDFIPDADEAAGSGARYLCKNAGGTDVLATTDIMTLDFITDLAMKARTSDPKISPLRIDGEDAYVLFIHPLQGRDLRKSADWKTAAQYAHERSDKNPLFRGALGWWSNVMIVEHEMVPVLDISKAGNSFRGAAVGTDCNFDAARAILCGRQALAYAEVYNPDTLVEETFDYKNKKGVAISFIGGVQKTSFDNKEFGVVVGDTAVNGIA